MIKVGRLGQLVQSNLQSTLQSALRRGAGDDAREERGERDDAPDVQPPNMQSTSAFWDGHRGDRSRTLSACLAAKAGWLAYRIAISQPSFKRCESFANSKS